MNKYIKNEIRNASYFIIGGIALIILGLFQEYNDKKTLITFGIAFGIIGIAQIIIYLLVKNKPEYIANLKAEKEERSVFIRDKSAKFTFWATFGAITVSSNISFISNLNARDYAICILIYMSIIYMGAFIYNLKKY